MFQTHTGIPGFNVRIAEQWLNHRQEKLSIICQHFCSMLCQYAQFQRNSDGTLTLQNKGKNFIRILPDFKMDYWGRRFGLAIDLIYVEEKNKGIGGKIMRRVCRRADIEQVELFCCPIPFSINPESDKPFHIDSTPRAGALNKTELIAWYSRLGFELFSSSVGAEYGYKADDTWLRRKPKQEIEKT